MIRFGVYCNQDEISINFSSRTRAKTMLIVTYFQKGQLLLGPKRERPCFVLDLSILVGIFLDRLRPVGLISIYSNPAPYTPKIVISG